MSLFVGVDFDNTIVSYDALFHRICADRGHIPNTLPQNKSVVRDHMHAAGNEAAWTEIQGVVYGSRMLEAEAFPGAIDFFLGCRAKHVDVAIISHKTRFPYAGERVD